MRNRLIYILKHNAAIQAIYKVVMSFVFDYSVLCGPILTCAYDYDTYLAERGTYFAMDEKYPNKTCRTEDELLDRILNLDYAAECQNTRRFRDEFIQYGNGATEICVKKMLG